MKFMQCRYLYAHLIQVYVKHKTHHKIIIDINSYKLGSCVNVQYFKIHTCCRMALHNYTSPILTASSMTEIKKRLGPYGLFHQLFLTKASKL